MLTMPQALRVGSRSRSQVRGRDGLEQHSCTEAGFGLEGSVSPLLSLPQQSLPHVIPLWLLSIISFLLAVFTGACCFKHCFTVTGCHCSATGRFSTSIIFPLNTSKATEKHLVNLFTSSGKIPKTLNHKTRQNKTKPTTNHKEVQGNKPLN